MNKKELFEKAYNGSYYTITGVAGEDEYKKGYQEELDHREIGKIEEWYSFTGKEFNEYYGVNRFPNTLHFLCFPLDGLKISKLAMLKLSWGDRWFDDIVDNLNTSVTLD